MKKTIRWLVILLVLGGLAAAAYVPLRTMWIERSKPKFRTERVTRGDVIETVNATGSVKPVLSISIGAFVSGPIQEIHCEFNQEVKQGDLLAKIDPRLYESNVARDQANYDNRLADVKRVEAQLQQAINNERRAMGLREEDASFISQQEIDNFHFGTLSLQAQLEVAKSAVAIAKAQLDNSLTNLEYTKIIAPESGMIIDRKIDPGQTLASQFQTPELFILAPDMRARMHVHATVDEADIGEIRAAKEKRARVTFTVDAYRDELFEGSIEEIRLSYATTQNVVTYPVIVSAPNPDLKLMPGMTANISFETRRVTNVLKVPNAALRYYPDLALVRKEDKPLLEGRPAPTAAAADDSNEVSEQSLSAEERSELRRNRNRRHVWVQDGDQLRAVEVVLGISDAKYSELISGELTADQLLVTGKE